VYRVYDFHNNNNNRGWR